MGLGMKKYFICILFTIIGIILVGFGLFSSKSLKETGTYSKVTKEADSAVEEVVEEVKEEPVLENEEVNDVVVSNNEVVSEVSETKVEEAYQNINTTISGNYIKIGDVLYNNLMQDDGSNFYLNHNINGVYDGIGVPYVDFRNDFTDRKTIIYSHSSMRGNGPFQVLQQYDGNKWFYDNNKYITISYNGNTYNYLIFSVYISVADSEESPGLEYFHRMDYTDSDWNETINYYKNNSMYDTGVSVDGNDKIVILQTCSMNPNYYQKSYRYNLLVMGKLV